MKAEAFLLALLIANATADTASSGKLNYGEASVMFLKSLKKMMPCGFEADNLAVLDPLSVYNDIINQTVDDTYVTVSLVNLHINGLSKMQLLSTSYDVDKLQSTFDIVFPKIQLFGQLKLESTLNIGGISLAWVETVNVNTKIIDTRLVGEYTFDSNQNGTKGLRINSFNLRIFVADVKAANWADTLNIAFNEFLNGLVSSFSLFFIKQVQPFVNANFNFYFLQSINVMLSKLNLNQLINLCVSYAEKWNKVKCEV